MTRQITIPREYYQTAKKTYGDYNWQEAWWREAIQNSVDAGATEIYCDVNEEELYHWLITPHYNKAHHDHFHVELRSNSGTFFR